MIGCGDSAKTADEGKGSDPKTAQVPEGYTTVTPIGLETTSFDALQELSDFGDTL